MSINKLEELARDNIRCDYCGAAPTIWCETSAGRPTLYLHESRMIGVRLGHGLGYDEASAEAARDPEGFIRWAKRFAGV